MVARAQWGKQYLNPFAAATIFIYYEPDIQLNQNSSGYVQ